MIGASSAGMLNLFSGPSVSYSTRQALDTVIVDDRIISGPVTDIYRNNERTLRVADACNGLELIVLHIGFLLCFPAVAARKWRFALWGILLICLMNIIRCGVLVLIYVHYRKMLDFSHHFVFTFIVYLAVFLLWFVYTKKPRPHGSRSVAQV